MLPGRQMPFGDLQTKISLSAKLKRHENQNFTLYYLLSRNYSFRLKSMPLSCAFTDSLWQNLIDAAIILGSHSPVFLTAISGPSTEEQNGEYEIEDATFIAVCKMVEFMYTGTYAAPPTDSSVADDICRDACFHAQMVALADKYLISALFEIARENFDASVASESNALALLGSVPDIYAIDADGGLALREILGKQYLHSLPIF
ncbi:hypothetical protein LMH87_006557 [Akanthomyces muscarius]|uniref:BTB domain-containing protein n=1 Tax=Akanthomyces muscarius TaxID=2231603 RepID=A0A9W8UTA1_AKAMU|nr:hypothetical protein LMH87_006557 [Akanthomyces muscarius]KAJ4164904.1 hypothetical protein LMH87_006557 [Akanthomyces muscarius]